MHFRETHQPDVLASKSGHGCVHFFFGLPFLAFGVLALLASVGLIGREKTVLPFGLVFGAGFSAIGLAIMTGRGGVVLDGPRRTVTKWWSVIGLRRAKETPVEDGGRVSLSREVRSSNKSSYTVYPVRLEGEGKPLELYTPQSFEDARAAAEQAAKLFHLDLVDRSKGAEIVRESGTLDESLRERYKRTGEGIHVPDPPPGTKVQFEVRDGELVLTLPKRERVLASVDRLRVEKGRSGRKAVEIPADELEELILPELPKLAEATAELERMPAIVRKAMRAAMSAKIGGIEARSDRAVAEFGKSLTPEEMRWVHALVLRVLTA